MSAGRRFDASLESPRRARRHLTEQLRHLDPDTVDAAALLVAELAANAVRHAGTAFDVSWTVSPASLRVEVTDSGGGAPRVRTPGHHEASGRGLAIVEKLASAWGIRTDGARTTVWFELPLRPRSDVREVTADAAARPPGRAVSDGRRLLRGGLAAFAWPTLASRGT